MSREEEKKLENAIDSIQYRIDDKAEQHRAYDEKCQITWTERGAKDDERDRCR